MLAGKATADGSQTLFSERYAQTFHSDKGALSESRHVFLAASGIAERLQNRQPSSVLEVGFGTGLNFFLTADVALKHEVALTFVSLEQTLLASELVRSLQYDSFLEYPEILTAYLRFRDSLAKDCTPGPQQFSYGTLRLELLLGEATVQNLPESYVDAIYHDAFSPDANPELWSESFFSKLYQALKPEGKLTTYSVKGEVRRRLKALGFAVEKLPGPVAGKREMLRAVKPAHTSA